MYRGSVVSRIETAVFLVTFKFRPQHDFAIESSINSTHKLVPINLVSDTLNLLKFEQHLVY